VSAAPWERAGGYHLGDVDTVISVEDVQREAEKLRVTVGADELRGLARGKPFVSIEGLRAGYGNMEILHDFTLHVAKSQSLCLIGPNGAGKSTVLHSIFGFTRIFGGAIFVGEGAARRNVTHLRADRTLKEAGIAYILQDKSVFPDMTVEENLWMGGYLLGSRDAAKAAAEKVFAKYDRLAARRNHKARVLSGGERRLLEISRALVMQPEVLLVDEPSIGLEPRFIDMVFEILNDLQHKEGKTIIMVEQNAKKGLEFADLGYVLVSASRTRRRAWSSPTSATCWCRGSSRLPAAATSCSRIPRSASCSWAARPPCARPAAAAPSGSARSTAR
jgi:branched-chain amino acid transport system ATP-binding protein